MSGEARRLLRRLQDARARSRVARTDSAYLSLERAFPELRPTEPGSAEAPDDHGRYYTYKRGCKCAWCREAARLAKARQRERQRAARL